MKTTTTFSKAITAMTAALLLFVVPFNSAKASENGTVKVTVVDEGGDPGFGALVYLISGTQVMDKKNADDGTATFVEVQPGTYDVKVEMIGKNSYTRTGIEVAANKTNYIDVKLTVQVNTLPDMIVEADKKSMVQETMSTGQIISEMQFKNSATERGNVISMIVSVTPGVMPTADGKDMYSRGARRGTMEYMIDGEKVIGSFDVPSQSVRGMTVYTGGVPACYGDFTGGLVMITTKSFFNGLQSKKQMYDEIQKHMDEMDQWQKDQKEQNQQQNQQQKQDGQ